MSVTRCEKDNSKHLIGYWTNITGLLINLDSIYTTVLLHFSLNGDTRGYLSSPPRLRRYCVKYIKVVYKWGVTRQFVLKNPA